MKWRRLILRNDFRGFSKTPVSISGFMYSDDGGTTFTDGGQLPTAASPTFVPRRVIAAGITDGQGAILRFAGNGSPLAVVTWTRFPSGLLNNIGLARSTDNGVTWSGP